MEEGKEKGVFNGEKACLVVKELRKSFESGKTRSYKWRISQLEAIAMMIQEREKDIIEAVYKDLSKPPLEAYIAEVSRTKTACSEAIKALHQWMKPEKVKTGITTYPSSAEIVSEPLGVVLIISTWNFPFMTSLEPVVGAIAAGNAVVLKPSEVAPASSALLADLVENYLDNSAIRVIEGGVPEATALLEQKWDKILYTGSCWADTGSFWAYKRVVRELKQLILSHHGSEGGREIGNLAYQFQALIADDQLEYRPSWISEDSHVWMTFKVHKRVMEDKVMEFYAEVRHTGCSSSFRPFVLPTATAPSMLLALEDVAMRDYNSGNDSDYEDESSYASTEENEELPNTPMVGRPDSSSPHRCSSLIWQMYQLIFSN
ncbi:hypothetical protein PIB30_068162 [Stylosanthes scabra]|uniref:Aldehyde dehydrogenase domain-containing protein n=1 Tax=Stylosanthes scabra TaxID=79078 RepID=A0ABU6VPN9_9FABA|nr:hypothetical protein [Stylosanthes scabra]